MRNVETPLQEHRAVDQGQDKKDKVTHIKKKNCGEFPQASKIPNEPNLSRIVQRVSGAVSTVAEGTTRACDSASKTKSSTVRSVIVLDVKKKMNERNFSPGRAL